MPCIELAHVRNMLFNNRFTENEKEILLSIKEKVINDKNKFMPLILLGIDNCFADLNTDNIKKAGIEINFLHNLPITNNKWDEEYFYTVELLGYIENINDVTRIKKVINVLAEIVK